MNTLKFNDMIKKYEYYKTVVIKDYIEKGIYPNQQSIESALKRIDFALPILQNYNIVEGSKFDTKQYDDMLQQIYTDLRFLYELTYDITVTRLNQLKNSLECRLLGAKNKADTAYKRALIEINSTALGETIYYNSNIMPNINNNICTIPLGDIELYAGSQLACMLTTNNNINIDDIVFVLHDKVTKKDYYTPVYNSEQYPFIVPGELISKTYNVNIIENEKLTSSTLVSLGSGHEYGTDNRYVAYSGKNKMIVRNKKNGSCTVVDIPINTACKIEEDSYIEFYILNGGDLNFTYNKKPVSANFELTGTTVDTTKHKHIFFECNADTVFSINIDYGDIYAHNNNTIYNNGDSLTIKNPHKLKDFLIYEYEYEENIKNYTVDVKINNINTQELIIDNIMIKELLPIK